MRAKSIWRAGLLAIILAAVPVLTPGAVQAQGYALPDWSLPVPWGSTRPEDGGFYVDSDFVMYRQTMPLRNEVVATRGFYNINAQDGNVGQFGGADFLGSGTVALDTNQVRGPTSYQPGVDTHIGWKFADESTLSLGWLYLTQVRYQAVATAAAPNFNYGVTFADSFISSPVYNFPSDYAGVPSQAAGPNGVATYGIWDGASQMIESFVQRTQAYDLIWRKPIYEQENYRFSSLLGPRFFWIWEKYDWKTTNFGFTGSDGPTADYNNIDSNRMYGYNVGCSQEWYWGNGFACQLDTSFTPFIDIVKERVQVTLGGDLVPGSQNKRAKTDYTFAPEVEAKLKLVWYPTENVQINIGYDIMAFFNTIQSEQPIDFNYSSLDPKFDHVMYRMFDGITAGLCFTF